MLGLALTLVGCADAPSERADELRRDADVGVQKEDGGYADADAPPVSSADGAVSASCEGEPLTLTAPPTGASPLPQPASNPMTAAGVALGRKLFFDPRLSADGTVSCATCHDQDHGFSDGQRVSTRGVSGKALTRNTPSLWNVAWLERGLFWDGGSKNLESLSLAPLTHPDEMGREGLLDALMDDLVADSAYAQLFERAFGAEGFTLGNLLRALAQFQRGLIAADSRWDKRAEQPLEASEAAGEGVFMQHCSRCHTPGLFTDGDFHNNGLGAEYLGKADDPAQGRARVSLSAADRGKYKTPGLRDIARSGPYMHDGRFETLQQVIEHYRGGMVASPSLDPGFVRPSDPPGVALTDVEAAQLQSFLRTLTQESRSQYGLPCDRE